MQCVELFTGCGGLALGLSQVGFVAQRMSERDKHSVLNISHNKARDLEHVRDWPICQEDVRSVDWSAYRGVDLVAGGPPCQPFSIGGRHKGHQDERDMWPEAVRAVREIEPAAFLFENVRGITRQAFADYLRWVLMSLALPQIVRKRDEDRLDHLARLERKHREFLYDVTLHQVNAADYGAAQKRHRVIILGFRRDLEILPPKLRPSHSRESLLWDQWVSGAYWKRHGIRTPKAGPNKADIAIVERLQSAIMPPPEQPWRTIRDATSDLGAPSLRSSFFNHAPQSGARSYPGHTGSLIDMPAKALKAGVHGVPGGENMMALPDGSVRYFTVREAARLQGLPDEYEFVGSWSENMRQCGNAVPVQLAEQAGRTMLSSLEAVARARSRRAA